MRYGVLFEIEILHDYFLNLGSRVHEALDPEPRAAARRAYSVASFLQVLPTRRTRRMLAGHRSLVKPTANGFLVGVRLDPAAPDDRPAVPPGEDLRLTFALRVKDPRFFNYTALRSTPGFYRFSNGSGNEAAGRRFLSLPVPAYDPGAAYSAGEVHAAAGSGPGDPVDLFCALRDTGPAAAPVTADWQRIPPDTWDPSAAYNAGSVVLSANRLYEAQGALPAGSDLSDPSQWQPLGALANQYVTAADHRVLKPARFELDLSGAALPQATVRLFRPGETTAAWEKTYASGEGTLSSVRVELGGLGSGPYRLEVVDGAEVLVEGLGFDLYLDPGAVRESWFGVIEIDAGSGGMALLDVSGVLRSPLYTLRFLNRATRWRYLFPVGQAIGVGAEVAPESPDDPRVLVTAEPLPLTRFGTGVRLQADDPSSADVSEEVLLPRPEARTIGRRNQQWTSEIHMSNLRLEDELS